MTRCADFYKKWQRAHNFCEEQYRTVRNIDNYLETVEEIQLEYGILQECTFVHFSEGAARVLNERRNSKYKERATEVIACRINAGTKISKMDTIHLLQDLRAAERGGKDDLEEWPEDRRTDLYSHWFGVFCWHSMEDHDEKYWSQFVDAATMRCKGCPSFEDCKAFPVDPCVRCGKMLDCDDAKELTVEIYKQLMEEEEAAS